MSESDLKELLKKLMEVLKDLELDFSWLITVVSLILQEIAIKKKLLYLDVEPGTSNFGELIDKLAKEMEERGMITPPIILKLVQASRRPRALMLHDPRSPQPTLKEAEAMLSDTEALVDALFGERIEVDVSEFIESITKDRSEFEKTVKTFKSLNKKTKLEIFDRVLDKIVVRTSAVGEKDKLARFLKETLIIEDDDGLICELFEKVVRRLPQAGLYKIQILSVLAEVTKVSTVKRFLKNRRDIMDILINNYMSSESYDIAGKNAEIMSNIADLLTSQDLESLVDSAVENRQIRESYSARPHLRNIFMNYHGRMSSKSATRLKIILKE